MLLTGTSLFFAALAVMSQAMVLAIFFISPLVVTLLAPLLLGEKAGAWRIAAVAAGFAGVLLILRPGGGVTLAYTAVVGAVVMTLIVPFIWVTPSLRDLGVMVLMGVFAAGGHYLLIRAFDHAPATFLAPLGYAEMVTALLLGWFAWGDLPDLFGWLGIAVIIGAGVAVSVRDARLARRGTIADFRSD